MDELENDPEFKPLFERFQNGDRSDELLDELSAVRKRHGEKIQEVTKAEEERKRIERLSKMTTSEKISEGLKQSKPSMGSQQYRPRANSADLEQQTVGMSRASANIRRGLAESDPARGPSKPAA